MTPDLKLSRYSRQILPSSVPSCVPSHVSSPVPVYTQSTSYSRVAAAKLVMFPTNQQHHCCSSHHHQQSASCNAIITGHHDQPLFGPYKAPYCWLQRTTSTILPIMLIIHFTLTLVTVLIYTLSFHRVLPQKFVIGVTATFAILFVALATAKYVIWLKQRRRGIQASTVQAPVFDEGNFAGFRRTFPRRREGMGMSQDRVYERSRAVAAQRQHGREQASVQGGLQRRYHGHSNHEGENMFVGGGDGEFAFQSHSEYDPRNNSVEPDAENAKLHKTHYGLHEAMAPQESEPRILPMIHVQPAAPRLGDGCTTPETRDLLLVDHVQTAEPARELSGSVKGSLGRDSPRGLAQRQRSPGQPSRHESPDTRQPEAAYIPPQKFGMSGELLTHSRHTHSRMPTSDGSSQVYKPYRRSLDSSEEGWGDRPRRSRARRAKKSRYKSLPKLSESFQEGRHGENHKERRG
ncbi:unnamed protein product [Diplocarpon coronariae]